MDHEKKRFDNPWIVARLRHDTDIPGLYLTGQDLMSAGPVLWRTHRRSDFGEECCQGSCDVAHEPQEAVKSQEGLTILASFFNQNVPLSASYFIFFNIRHSFQYNAN
jgi:hypothetical protein